MEHENDNVNVYEMTEFERRKKQLELKRQKKELEEKREEESKNHPGCVIGLIVSLLVCVVIMIIADKLPTGWGLLLFFVGVPLEVIIIGVISLESGPKPSEKEVEIAKQIDECEAPDREKALERFKLLREKIVDMNNQFTKEGTIFSLVFSQENGETLPEYFYWTEHLCKREDDNILLLSSPQSRINYIDRTIKELESGEKFENYESLLQVAAKFPKVLRLPISDIEYFRKEGERTEETITYQTGGEPSGGVMVEVWDGVSTYIPGHTSIKTHREKIVKDERKTVLKLISGELICNYEKDPQCFDKLNALVPEKNYEIFEAMRAVERNKELDEEYEKSLAAHIANEESTPKAENDSEKIPELCDEDTGNQEGIIYCEIEKVDEDDLNEDDGCLYVSVEDCGYKDVETRLSQLKELFDRDLITQEEYDEKRRDILEDL